MIGSVARLPLEFDCASDLEMVPSTFPRVPMCLTRSHRSTAGVGRLAAAARNYALSSGNPRLRCIAAMTASRHNAQVSVIVLVYRQVHYAYEAIESVLRQTKRRLRSSS